MPARNVHTGVKTLGRQQLKREQLVLLRCLAAHQRGMVVADQGLAAQNSIAIALN